MTPQTTNQLKILLRQSYDIFEIYGKKPSQLRNILNGFADVLAPYHQKEITAAFRTWLHRESKFPTPSAIKQIIDEQSYHRNQTPDIPDDDWPEWKAQLADDLGISVVKSWFDQAGKNGEVLTMPTRFKKSYVIKNYKNQLASVGITEIKWKGEPGDKKTAE